MRANDKKSVGAAARKAATEFRHHKAPGFLIRRLDSRLASLYESYTGQTDVTPRQLGLMLMLFQSGPLPQTELGNSLYLDRSTLAEMLQRMLERKLISRRVYHRDRRAIEIRLTSVGRKAVLQNVISAVASEEAFFMPLPEYLRPVFRRCLEILVEADVGKKSKEVGGDHDENQYPTNGGASSKKAAVR